MVIKLLVLRCTNIEISKEFYELLGFGFKKEQHGKGPVHFASDQNDFVLELYPAKNNENDNIRLGFEIDNLLSKLERLKVLEEYEFNSTKVRVVADPDGRKIELYEKTP